MLTYSKCYFVKNKWIMKQVIFIVKKKVLCIYTKFWKIYLSSLFEATLYVSLFLFFKKRLHGKKFRICTYLKWNVLHLLINDILNKLLSLEQIYQKCIPWPISDFSIAIYIYFFGFFGFSCCCCTYFNPFGGHINPDFNPLWFKSVSFSFLA